MLEQVITSVGHGGGCCVADATSQSAATALPLPIRSAGAHYFAQKLAYQTDCGDVWAGRPPRHPPTHCTRPSAKDKIGGSEVRRKMGDLAPDRVRTWSSNSGTCTCAPDDHSAGNNVTFRTTTPATVRHLPVVGRIRVLPCLHPLDPVRFASDIAFPPAAGAGCRPWHQVSQRDLAGTSTQSGCASSTEH